MQDQDQEEVSTQDEEMLKRKKAQASYMANDDSIIVESILEELGLFESKKTKEDKKKQKPKGKNKSEQNDHSSKDKAVVKLSGKKEKIVIHPPKGNSKT